MNILRILLSCLAAPLVALWYRLRTGRSIFGHTNSGDASGALGDLVLGVTTVLGVVFWAAIFGAVWLIWHFFFS